MKPMTGIAGAFGLLTGAASTAGAAEAAPRVLRLDEAVATALEHQPSVLVSRAQARTDLANSRVTLINAQTGYTTARAQLNQAMGVRRPLDFDVSDEELPAPAEEDQEIPRLVTAAMDARPELKARAGLLSALGR